MNVALYYARELEGIMRRALVSGLLNFVVVFCGGVLFGWQYGLMIGFLILLLVNVTSRRGI